MPDAPKYVVPPTAAEECYDIVWVLGGLLSDPVKILKAIYGQYQGSLVILLDLGSLAIRSGESGKSVWDRLHGMVRCLKLTLRHPAKGSLRLVVLPPHCTPWGQRVGIAPAAVHPCDQTCPGR